MQTYLKSNKTTEFHVFRHVTINVLRRNAKYVNPWRRRRGGPLRRYMDVVKEDLKVVGATEKDTNGDTKGPNGGESSAVATPNGTSRKEKKKACNN